MFSCFVTTTLRRRSQSPLQQAVQQQQKHLKSRDGMLLCFYYHHQCVGVIIFCFSRLNPPPPPPSRLLLERSLLLCAKMRSCQWFALICVLVVLSGKLQCCHPYSSSGASAYEQCLAQTPENPNWGYEPENGPSTWGGLCTCGKHQSPINIQKDWFNGNSAITFGNYDSTGPLTMTNTGHTVVISGFDNWAHQPYISDGGLGTKYRLYQFHFHWSQNAAASSEHTVDGQFFDAELHMVHVKDAFSFGQARAISDGIAALGIFYKIGFDGRSILALQNGLNEVTSNGASSTNIANFVPAVNLPDDLGRFFRYNGSFTAPPGCPEDVVWLIFARPLSITSNQLTLLRAILGANGKPISPVRPVQHYSGQL